MKKCLPVIGKVCLTAVLILFISGSVFAAENITVVGTVNGSFQIVTDEGETYDLVDTDIAAEVMEYEGQKVNVTGTVEEMDGQKWMTVQSYKVVEE